MNYINMLRTASAFSFLQSFNRAPLSQYKQPNSVFRSHISSSVLLSRRSFSAKPHEDSSQTTKFFTLRHLFYLSIGFVGCYYLRAQFNDIDKKKAEFDKSLPQISQDELLGKSDDPLPDRLLHTAIALNHIDLINQALAQGASVSTFIDGISPLFRACLSGNFEVAELLLKKDANPNQVNYTPYQTKYTYPLLSLLDGAIYSSNKKIVKLLLDHHAFLNIPLSLSHISPLFFAIHCKEEEIALFLVNGGADIHQRNYDSVSTMEYAVAKGLLNLVRELHYKGIKLDNIFKNGDTLLHIAARYGQYDVLDFLLQNGAKDLINHLNNDNSSPIYEAVFWGNLECVELLVECGADLTIMYDCEPVIVDYNPDFGYRWSDGRGDIANIALVRYEHT